MLSGLVFVIHTYHLVPDHNKSRTAYMLVGHCMFARSALEWYLSRRVIKATGTRMVTVLTNPLIYRMKKYEQIYTVYICMFYLHC